MSSNQEVLWLATILYGFVPRSQHCNSCDDMGIPSGQYCRHCHMPGLAPVELLLQALVGIIYA